MLVLPVLNNTSFDWVAYYPRRLARLYLPAIASVALAAAWIQLANPNPADASSRWVAGASVAPHWRLILSGSDLLFGDNSLNSPLWSLRWEVVFSLGLPLFAASALFTRRYWPCALIASWGVVFVGMVAGNDTLALLPLFFAGSVLAVKVDAIHSWMAPRTRSVTPQIGGVILLAGCLALLTVRWMVWTVMPDEQRLLTLADSLQFFGAVGLVSMAAFWAPFDRVLCARPVQWLGRLSFSLYLVHVPVLIAVGAVIGRDHAGTHGNRESCRLSRDGRTFLPCHRAAVAQILPSHRHCGGADGDRRAGGRGRMPGCCTNWRLVLAPVRRLKGEWGIRLCHSCLLQPHRIHDPIRPFAGEPS